MKAQGSATGQHGALARLALILVFSSLWRQLSPCDDVLPEAGSRWQSWLQVLTPHLHRARDLVSIAPLPRNVEQIAIFEIAAKRWLMRSTTVNGFEFQSYTDCLKVCLPAGCCWAGAWYHSPFHELEILPSLEKNALWFLRRSVMFRAARWLSLCVIWGRGRDGSEKRSKERAVRDIWSVSAGQDAEPWQWSAEVMRIAYE